MSYIEENLEREGKLPSFYRRYVVDTLTIMPNIATASNSMDTHDKAHASVKFMMETDSNGMLPFLAIQVLNRSPKKLRQRCTKNPLIQVYSCIVKVMLTIGTKMAYWELCFIEHIVYLHLSLISPTNVTVGSQHSPVLNTSLALPSKVSLIKCLWPAAAFITIPGDRWHDAIIFRGCEWGSPTSDEGRENITDYKKKRGKNYRLTKKN